MQRTEKEEQGQKEKYCCPNPNCNRVFSRPKLIKYYVCPNCQTLVRMETAQGKSKKKKHRPTEEDIKRKEAARLEAVRKAERLESERLEAERRAKQLEEELKAERVDAERKVGVLEAKRKEAERKVEGLEEERKADRVEAERLESERLEAERRAKEPKKVKERQQVKKKEPKTVVLSQVKQSVEDTEDIEQSSDSGCKYYFGYLGQRDKGDEIPDACFECPQSLDCMLQSYKSKESVAEIKKWYPFKH